MLNAALTSRIVSKVKVRSKTQVNKLLLHTLLLVTGFTNESETMRTTF